MENLFDAIFTRKSVRKYERDPLGADRLAEIKSFIQGIKPLHPAIQVQFEIVGPKDISSIQPIGAPHYLVAFSKRAEGHTRNIGFMMQQIDLYLSSTGLGSCYLGMAKPSSAVKDRSKLDFIMLMAFGKAADDAHREPSQFNRKAADQIASGQPFWLEEVRLAPSATNGQPWYFDCRWDGFDAYCEKQHRIKALIYDRLNGVDMGIALCHIDLAVQRAGRKAVFYHDGGKQATAPKGYLYALSGEISQA